MDRERENVSTEDDTIALALVSICSRRSSVCMKLMKAQPELEAFMHAAHKRGIEQCSCHDIYIVLYLSLQLIL